MNASPFLSRCRTFVPLSLVAALAACGPHIASGNGPVTGGSDPVSGPRVEPEKCAPCGWTGGVPPWER